MVILTSSAMIHTQYHAGASIDECGAPVLLWNDLHNHSTSISRWLWCLFETVLWIRHPQYPVACWCQIKLLWCVFTTVLCFTHPQLQISCWWQSRWLRCPFAGGLFFTHLHYRVSWRWCAKCDEMVEWVEGSSPLFVDHVIRTLRFEPWSS